MSISMSTLCGTPVPPYRKFHSSNELAPQTTKAKVDFDLQRIAHHRAEANQTELAPTELVALLADWIDGIQRAGFLMLCNGLLYRANRIAWAEILGESLCITGEGIVRPASSTTAKSWDTAFQNAKQNARATLIVPHINRLTAFSFQSVTTTVDSVPMQLVLVTASRDAAHDSLVLAAYAQNFGLTPSETETLTLMCTGDCIAKISQSRHVKESTIRTQVRAVLSKTGCSSIREVQAEIARLSSA